MIFKPFDALEQVWPKVKEYHQHVHLRVEPRCFFVVVASETLQVILLIQLGLEIGGGHQVCREHTFDCFQVHVEFLDQGCCQRAEALIKRSVSRRVFFTTSTLSFQMRTEAFQEVVQRRNVDLEVDIGIRPQEVQYFVDEGDQIVS